MSLTSAYGSYFSTPPLQAGTVEDLVPTLLNALASRSTLGAGENHRTATCQCCAVAASLRQEVKRCEAALAALRETNVALWRVNQVLRTASPIGLV